MKAKATPRDPLRTIDAARLLPVLGIVLLMPPLISLFARDVGIFGIPLIVVYVFGVWLALIVGAVLLARRLRSVGERADAPPPPEG